MPLSYASPILPIESARPGGLDPLAEGPSFGARPPAVDLRWISPPAAMDLRWIGRRSQTQAILTWPKPSVFGLFSGPSVLFAATKTIGAPGFEPGTSATQRPRATRLRHAPPAVGVYRWPAGDPRTRSIPPSAAPVLGSATAMADIQPLRALHYDLSAAGPLADLTAPPYDVIDADQRAALIARSAYNVVAVDLPKGEPDPYATAGQLFSSWQSQRILVRDPEPALWAHTQEYTGPDGLARARRGFFCKVRVEEYGPGLIRPHERTHPGPKEDRLRLTRATKANISPIFSLYSDPSHGAWEALAPAAEDRPWGEVTDGDGTTHRLWRVADPDAIASVRESLRERELLIADGHHRYETARAYADEIGGEGEHRYLLMCLVALEDPGLTVFPTHRLVRFQGPERRDALAAALDRDFVAEEVPIAQIAPSPGDGPLQLGYLSSGDGKPTRLTLRDQAIADAALAGYSQAYRHLDTGVLETLILKGALGLSDDDISHFKGLWYARDTAEALRLVQSGEYDAAFLLRPTPVTQVKEVAAAGENMPPKSTFFFPKLLTGLLFNPLS
jgi:uncharacterized protein (DUF1015 family)